MSNIGKVHSEESKQKIRIAMTNRICSDQMKQKISKLKIGNKNFLGKKHSEETKKKMSDTAKGRVGWKHSEEVKRKIGETSKGNTNNLGKKYSKEHIQKIIESEQGEKSHFHKLKNHDVLKIIEMNPYHYKEIAKLYNVHKDTIKNIFTGKCWSHITGFEKLKNDY